VSQISKDVTELTKEKRQRQDAAQDNAIHEVEDRVGEVSETVKELASQTKEQEEELDKISKENKRESAVQKVLQLANIASLSSGGGGAAAVAAAEDAMKAKASDDAAAAAAADATKDNNAAGDDTSADQSAASGVDETSAEEGAGDDAESEGEEDDTGDESTENSILTAAALGAFRPAPYPSVNYQPQNPPAPSPHRLPSGYLQRPGPVSVFPGGGPTGRLARDHFDSPMHIHVVYPAPPQEFAVPAEGQFIEPEMRSDQD